MGYPIIDRFLGYEGAMGATISNCTTWRLVFGRLYRSQVIFGIVLGIMVDAVSYLEGRFIANIPTGVRLLVNYRWFERLLIVLAYVRRCRLGLGPSFLLYRL